MLGSSWHREIYTAAKGETVWECVFWERNLFSTCLSCFDPSGLQGHSFSVEKHSCLSAFMSPVADWRTRVFLPTAADVLPFSFIIYSPGFISILQNSANRNQGFFIIFFKKSFIGSRIRTLSDSYSPLLHNIIIPFSNQRWTTNMQHKTLLQQSPKG